MGANWDPALYQSGHAFVWEYGRELVELLAPRAGQLTAEIVSSGAQVIGIDSSQAMIEEPATSRAWASTRPARSVS
jgi:trans-aconitate methyltransferase